MKLKTLVCVLSVTSVVGCSKASKNKASEAEKTTATAAVGGLDISSDPLKKLNLSSSLSPEVPKSISAKGDGVQSGALDVLTLVEGRKKSREACNIRQKIKEAKMNQDSMAMDLCMIEAQRGMKAGGKYKMTFKMPEGGGPGGEMPTGGPGGAMPSLRLQGGSEMSFSVFLDNSDSKNFKVFTCDGGKLTQKIVLSDAKEKGSKGSYKSVFGDEGMKIQLTGAFDNGVGSAGRQKTLTQMSFEMGDATAKTYMRSTMQLDISPTALSTVKVANESSSSFGDFSAADKEIGVALIGPNIGSALFLRTFTGSGSFGPPPGDATPEPTPEPTVTLFLTEGSQSVETSRTYFDNKGQTLAQSDSPSFKTDGVLDVKETMFPKLLPNDFKVEFEAGDWDCSGTVDFDMDTGSDAFKGCTDRFAASFSEETCTADGYEIGSQVTGLGEFATKRDVAFDETPNFDPFQ